MATAALDLDELRDVVQDSNINFFIGSGMSCPYFPTLGNIERLLTELEGIEDIDTKLKKLIRASIYRHYYNGVIRKNLGLLPGTSTNDVLDNYCKFLKALNTLLLKRKSTMLSKQVNVFTTNIDIFLERAFEAAEIECNDGFSGRFEPKYNISNFKKTHFKKSLHYDNTSEIPVFNLVKVHGALTWRADTDGAVWFDRDLNQLEPIDDSDIPEGSFLEISDSSTAKGLYNAAKLLEAEEVAIERFTSAYEKLSIVNPEKTKFRHTTLNQTYYDLLRIYANELEKENTVLFVMGFSFADEHLRDITLRAANSNPTLLVYVFCYDHNAFVEISSRFPPDSVRNANVRFIGPESDEDTTKYDFDTINRNVFQELLAKIAKSAPRL